MALQDSQPENRFDRAGPFGRQGISFQPKVFFFKKESISGTSNNDFWAAPAGAYIQQVCVRADVALDGSGTVDIGTDGNSDAFIDQTDFDPTTIGNFATNIGSTTAAGALGMYLKDGDTIRLEVGGSPTVGAVSGYFVYYEMDAMFEQGVHFDMT